MAATKKEVMDALYARLSERQESIRTLAQRITAVMTALPGLVQELESEVGRFLETFGGELLDESVRRESEHALFLCKQLDTSSTSKAEAPANVNGQLKTPIAEVDAPSSRRQQRGAADVNEDIDRVIFSQPKDQTFTYIDVSAQLKQENIEHEPRWVSTRLSRLKDKGLVRTAGKQSVPGQRAKRQYYKLSPSSAGAGQAPLRGGSKRREKKRQRTQSGVNVRDTIRRALDSAGATGLLPDEVWRDLRESGVKEGRRQTMHSGLHSLVSAGTHERTSEGRYRRKRT